MASTKIFKNIDLLILIILFYPFFLLHWNGALDPRVFGIFVFHQIFPEKTGFFAALASGIIIWAIVIAIYYRCKKLAFKIIKG